MNVSDTTKQVMETIEYDRQAKTLFFVLDKADGKHDHLQSIVEVTVRYTTL